MQINSTAPDAGLGASEGILQLSPASYNHPTNEHSLGAPAVAPAAADPVAPASEPAKLDTKAEVPKETKTTTKEKRASGFFKKLFGKKDKKAETS